MAYARKRADRVGSLAQTHERAKQFQEASTITSTKDGRKEILVPFYGDESESEIESRVRIAILSSLPDGVVHPVYCEEVPDETVLEALRNADAQAEMFESTFRRATSQWGDAIKLDTLVTHDAKLALFRAARALDARWILMGWQRKSLWNFLIQVHTYWWLHHSPCNVAQYLHRESGDIPKIAVMTEPGPYDALLVHVADGLSSAFDAEITLLHVTKQGTSGADIERVKNYHNELRQLFRRDVNSQIELTRRQLATAVKETANSDLLIIGVPSEERLLKVFSKSFEDQLAKKAACSVFQVQSPQFHSHEVAAAIPSAIEAEKFRISPFVHHGAVEAQISVEDKISLFKHISEKVAETTEIAADILGQAFWEREKLQNTALGQGVAIPHVVIPNLNETLIGVFTLLQSADFQSPDKSEVDVCIITAGPSDQRNIHLKLLGRTAYLIRETDLLNRFREAESDAQLVDAITTLDNQN